MPGTGRCTLLVNSSAYLALVGRQPVVNPRAYVTYRNVCSRIYNVYIRRVGPVDHMGGRYLSNLMGIWARKRDARGGAARGLMPSQLRVWNELPTDASGRSSEVDQDWLALLS
jgi:hypothetical protein